MMNIVQCVFPVQKVTTVRLARRDFAQQGHFLMLGPQTVKIVQLECSAKRDTENPAQKDRTLDRVPHGVKRVILGTIVSMVQ